jgi:PAS domain-containing protein
LTLDGVIREANLAGAALLGLDRSRVVSRQFGAWVAPTCLQTFATFCEAVLASDTKQTCEIQLLSPGRGALDVQLEGLAAPDQAGREKTWRLAVLDVKLRKRAEQRLAALSNLGLRLSAVHTDRQAAEVIVEFAGQLFGWHACQFNLYSRKPNRITQVFGQDTINGQKVESPPSAEQGEPSAFMRQVIDHGAKLVLKDPSTPLAGADPFGDRARPSASIMFVPIRRGADIVGVFSIHSYIPNAYTEEDLQTLQSVADYCGGALERLRAEAEAHRHAEALRASNEELTRFNDAMVGRELRMIELKQEINALCAQFGQPPRYGPEADADAQPPP